MAPFERGTPGGRRKNGRVIMGTYRYIQHIHPLEFLSFPEYQFFATA
jgi:hypothetical protein